MPLQGSGEMSFADVYNEITGESQANPPISITLAELGQLQNSSGQTIALNQYYTPRPDGNLPTVFPTEWYLYCQRCNVPAPYITISKTAPTSANSGQEFAYRLTIANNGQINSSGDIIVRDYIPNGLSFVRYERDTAAWGFSISGQQVTATFTSSLPVGFGAVITIYVTTSTQGTYSNYATVEGGGETITKTSNTVYTGVGGVPTWTSSVTKRLVRTIQKNNCDAYGVGSLQEVYSPFFTATYTSTISQADADANANTNATALCNQWLDANGQSVANQFGTCDYDYPQMTLSKSMPSSFNLNQSGEVEIIMRTLGAATSGNITMFDDLPSGFEYVSLIFKPDIFNLNIYGRSVTFTTSASLPAGYYGQFKFLVRGITVGNYTNFASAFGGSILNNNATSNTVSTYVFGNPSFAFSRGTINNTFVKQSVAAPTDDIYYYETVTIGNNPSTNSSLIQVLILLPSHLRVVDDVSVFINETYFTFSQGALPNIIIINQKENISVPVGQYTFYVRINLTIDYYRMSSIVQPIEGRPGDNLMINSSSTEVPRRQIATFYNYIAGNQVSVLSTSIDWANNYQFIPIFTTTNNRIPNDVNGLTWTYSINDNDNHSPQYPMFYDSGINRFFGLNYAFAVNAVRDTWTSESPVPVINATYPFYNTTVFEYRIYYQIYYQGNKIYSESYAPVYSSIVINKADNEPKFRNMNLKIFVLANGLYVPF
jgi:uncharacterized repeat protein (TIGR01451 family)